MSVGSSFYWVFCTFSLWLHNDVGAIEFRRINVLTLTTVVRPFTCLNYLNRPDFVPGGNKGIGVIDLSGHVKPKEDKCTCSRSSSEDTGVT
jgi:hypothetical protein